MAQLVNRRTGIVYTFLIQSTSRNASRLSSHVSRRHGSGDFLIQDAPRCIMKTEFGFFEASPRAPWRSAGQGKSTVQIYFSEQFLNKISCGLLKPWAEHTQPRTEFPTATAWAGWRGQWAPPHRQEAQQPLLPQNQCGQTRQDFQIQT